jgi:cyclopropane fatty-acyl-phospholipid synthase-like methyltransferase
MNSDYYKTRDSVSEYIELAKDVSGQEHIARLKMYLESGSDLLELGSGPGTDWRILSKDFNVTGSDNSEAFLVHLRANNSDGQFLNISADTIEIDATFDGIYSNKVLHHLTDEELASSVDRQFKILNSDGLICHTFWKGEGSEIFKGLFVNYHTEESLRSFFQPRFDILSIEPYAEFETDDSYILLGKKRS